MRWDNEISVEDLPFDQAAAERAFEEWLFNRLYPEEEPMAKKDEIELQPDDAKVEAKSETKKSPSKSELQARVDELEAKIARARKAFANNGHIQRILRD